MPGRSRLLLVFCPLAAAFASACEGPLPEDLDEQPYAVTVPSKGSASTLDVASWNIEWFGDSGNGPSNESLQLQNARDVINGTNFDVWGVAEIVSNAHWNNLESQLPGYAGFLANESSVINGPAFYAGTEQKVGIMYKTALASVLDARIILTASDFDFAGRPPLQVTLRVTLNGTTEDVIVIVLHAKCCSDSGSWQKRQHAANALKVYLDSNYPTQKVWVIGDFNDDVDTSITPQHASPYANFVDDPADYKIPTKALSDAGVASTIGFPDTIDHHVNSNEVNASYVASSAEVYRVDQYVANYGTTTSDHFPVLTRYSFGGGGGGSAQVVVNEILANEPGSNTAGEAIEILNLGSAAASIGGWTLSDASQIRHTFAAGTSLQPGKAIVVFASASAIPPGLTNAVAASTGDLNLANGGDTVTLRDGATAVKDSFAYGAALSGTDGVAMNRSPDGTTGGFVLHTALSGLQRSPGTRANGSAW